MPPVRTERFRFAARYGLLTYAQSGELDPRGVVAMLEQLGAQCVVARENHATEGVHLHAFFMFKRKFESRNVRVFDVDGRHPNVVAGYGTPEKGWDYAVKDNLVGGEIWGTLERPSGTSNSGTGKHWHDIILAPTRDEFFELVAQLDPRSLCTAFGSLEKYASWKYRESLDEYATPAGISFVTGGVYGLDQWVEDNLRRTSQGK